MAPNSSVIRKDEWSKRFIFIIISISVKNKNSLQQPWVEVIIFTRRQVWTHLYIIDFFFTESLQHIDTATDGKALPSGRIIRLTPFFFDHLFIIVGCIIYTCFVANDLQI